MATAVPQNNAHRPITARDKQLIDQHATLWIDRAMRTDPIEPDKIIPAIEGLYRHAGMKTPRVIVVPSPLVMAFAFGAAAAIWHCRKHNVDVTYNHGMANAVLAPEIGECSNIYSATVAAIHQATDSNIINPTDRDPIFTAIDDKAYTATRSYGTAAYDAAETLNRKSWTSTLNAVNTRVHKSWTSILYAGDARVNTTSAVTRDPLYNALIHATELPSDAAKACCDLAGDLGIQCSQRWWKVYQGGNMWAAREFYVTACREILELDLPHPNSYACWEQAAIHGSVRILHDEFCIVSDFPEIILKDQQNRPHSQAGPSHRWRDGWNFYHWHGTRVPEKWIEDKTYLTPTIALSQTNLELRQAACEILGWTNVIVPVF